MPWSSRSSMAQGSHRLHEQGGIDEILVYRAPSAKLLAWLGVIYVGPAVPGVALVGGSGGDLLGGVALTLCFWALISLWARHLFNMRVVFRPAAIEYYDPIKAKTHIVAYSMIYRLEYGTHRWFRTVKLYVREKNAFEIPDFFRDFEAICATIEERRSARR